MSFKLYYFDAPGRAEQIRAIFRNHKVAFEDVRIKMEQWPAMKNDPKFEFGQLPVLEVNGELIAQTHAIMYFLGKMYNLIPNDMMEEYEMNNIICAVNDLINAIAAAALGSKTPEEKKTKMEEFFTKTLPFTGEKIEAKIKNKANKCFLVGNSLTLADFSLSGLAIALYSNPEGGQIAKGVIAQRLPILSKYISDMLESMCPNCPKCNKPNCDHKNGKCPQGMSLKLYYFDAPGRAEQIRAIFRNHKVAFEDVRIKMEQWPAMKNDPKFEFGQLPVLEVNGELIAQTHAIMYFLGKMYNLIPNDMMEEYEMNNIICAVNDLINAIAAAALGSKTPEEKKTKMEEFFTKTLPFTGEKIEAKIKNKANKCFLVGNSLTLADFSLSGLAIALYSNPEGGQIAKGVIAQRLPILSKYISDMLVNMS